MLYHIISQGEQPMLHLQLSNIRMHLFYGKNPTQLPKNPKTQQPYRKIKNFYPETPRLMFAIFHRTYTKLLRWNEQITNFKTTAKPTLTRLTTFNTERIIPYHHRRYISRTYRRSLFRSGTSHNKATTLTVTTPRLTTARPTPRVINFKTRSITSK